MPDEQADSTGREESAPALQDMGPRLREALGRLSLLVPGAAVTPAAAATFCGLESEAEAGALLRVLRAQGFLDTALVRRADGTEEIAFRLLPYLEAEARADAHQLLLDRYRARTRDGAWYTLHDDGTIHGALAWHLEQAGRHEELRALLAEETAEGHSAWYEVRERLGQAPGYLQDLDRAWQRAGQEFAAGGPEAGPALALQCRYALVASSLRSLPLDIPPALLLALVRSKFWSPAQGLAAASQMPDPAPRGEALVHLAAAPEVPASMAADLIAGALAIDDELQRARTLLAFARHLPVEHLGLVLDGIRHLEGEAERARALVELAPHLPPAGVEQALAEALAIAGPACRVEAVTGLAAHLPARLLPQALLSMVEMDDEPRRAAALAHLAPHLPEPLCRQALACTWRMRDAAARSEAQAGLAPHLPAYWREKALAAALDGLAQVHHARATGLLERMAPHLPAALQERAIALAESQPDSYSRVSALGALLPHLARQYRKPAADLALRTTLLIRRESGRGEAIVRLVPHLPACLLERALHMAQSLADGRARAAALAGMAPFLDCRLAGTALTAAQTIQDERSCAMALAGLAPLLDTGQQRQALLRMRSLGDEKARAVALVGLAPVLAPDLLPGALAEVRRVADGRAQGVALAGIAPALDEAGRAGLLAMAADIADPAMRLDALLGLLPSLSADQSTGALAAGWRATQCLNDEQARVDALTRLFATIAPCLERRICPEWWCPRGDGQAQVAPHLTPSRGPVGDAVEAHCGQVWGEALASLSTIRDPERRCQALLALAPHLPVSLWEDALAALPLDSKTPATGLLALIPHLPGPLQVRAVDHCLAGTRQLPRPVRNRVLSGLVPYLEPKQLAEALVSAREIGDDEEQVQAIFALVPDLEDDERREALEAVGRVAEDWKRAALLATLAPHLPEVLWPEALSMVKEPDWAAASLAAHLPGTVPEILLSARQTSDLWAGALALTYMARVAGDEERGAIMREACQRARGIDDACSRAQTLGRLLALDGQAQEVHQLAPEMQQEVAGEVLQAVRDCPAGSRARLLGQALATVAPFLRAEELPAALAEARRLHMPRAWTRWPQANALAALFRRLPEEKVRSELAAAGTIDGLHLRAQTLSALALRLGELGQGQEALSATRSIEPLPYQVDALLHLAPHLSLPWLREALDITRDLGRHGAPAFACMVVRLAELGEAVEALEAASEIPGEGWQAEALAGVARHLPAGGRQATAYLGALEAACRIRNAGERLGALARLVPRLPADMQIAALREALGTAVAIKEAAACSPKQAGQRSRATPLAALAAPLAALAGGAAGADCNALREIWLAGGQGERLLRLLGRQPRSTTLVEMAILAPLLARLGGPSTRRELLNAVHQAARWWP